MNSHFKHPATPRLAHTYKEAGDLLGVSDRTVFTWVKEGRLKAMRVGRTVRITNEAIHQFIANHETAGAEGDEL